MRAAAYLLIDVGNARLKWAVMRAPVQPGPLPRPRAPFAARGVIQVKSLQRSSATLLRVLRSARTDAGVYVCNVAGPDVARQIRAAAAATGLGAPQFARSAARAAGVRNGYVEAWRLGVDRWLALIGAHHRYPDQDLCIVSIGSAMTIDLLTADGRHHGGSIAPGPHMMIDALLHNTAGISRRAGARSASASVRALAQSASARARRPALFARDTRSGLLSGCRHACALLIERSLEVARQRLSREPALILSGGGVGLIAPLLQTDYQRDDDLVLLGLAVLAADWQRR